MGKRFRLEIGSVTASDWREARDKVIEKAEERCGRDPYSGDFNTVLDWYEYNFSFATIESFKDWVRNNTFNREAYVMKHPADEKRYLVCGWCAC